MSFVIRSLLVTLGVFSFFRILLVVLNRQAISQSASLGLVLQTLLNGLITDLMTLGPVWIILLLLVLLHASLLRGQKAVGLLIFFLAGLGMQGALLVSSMDVPFFQHFTSRVTDMFLNWMDQPEFLIRMVTEETRFWWFIGIFMVISIGLWWWLVRQIFPLLRRKLEEAPQRGGTGFSIFMLVLLLFFSLVLRNRLTRRHFFAERSGPVSTVPYLEKISQNPVLSLLYSLTSRPVGQLLAERVSLSDALKGIWSTTTIKTAKKTLPGGMIPSSPADDLVPQNVVVVLMESINWDRMSSGLMPELQRIATQGTVWNRFFSSGVHTYAGIYATLNSFPVQLRRHAMKWGSDQSYSGLGSILAQKGYQTRFYTTHDAAFDNMGPFLRKNGFQKVVNLEDYDPAQVISTFGVPDHVMFARALEELDDQGGKRPFLAVLLSSSNHAPLRLPKGIPFEPGSSNLQDRLLEYSDWALGQFVSQAKNREWGGRTLFVFLGDHGASGDYRYPLPYSMVHIPLIMNGPGLSRGETVERLGSQLDVMPTILGRLGIPFRNVGFGLDLFRDERLLAYFCNDESMGCTDGNLLAVFDFDRLGSLYRLGDNRPVNMRQELLQRFNEMKDGALANWRLADWLVENRMVLTGPAF